MKIHILSHYYPPESGAPQSRLSDLAKYWREEGHIVTVLTCFPSHPTGVVPEEYRGQTFLEEHLDGIRVWRHPSYVTPNKGVIRKTLSHLSFMTSVILWSLMRGPTPDIIVVSSPTLFSVVSAWIFSFVRSAPMVFEVRDLWPGIFVELGVLKNRFLIGVLEKLELFLYRRAAHVIPVTDGFRENIIQRGIPADKVTVFTNGVDIKRFTPRLKKMVNREEWGLEEDQFIVLYAGAHGISHGLLSVLEAAKILMLHDAKIHFLFVGEGAVKQDLVRFAAKGQLSNVHFHPGVAPEGMPGLYAIADLCLVPLKAIPGFRCFIPSKMFEMMACARPILGALQGEAAAILEKSEGARIVSPEDSQEMANQILALKRDPERLKEMGKKAQAFVAEKYDRQRIATKYLRVLEEVIRQQDRRQVGIKPS